MEYSHTNVDNWSDECTEYINCLSKEELFQRYLIPYKKKLPVYVNGELINGKIHNIQIRQTTLNKDELQYFAKRELGNFKSNLKTYKFFCLFEDVTNDFVNHRTMYEEQLNSGKWANIHPEIYDLVRSNIDVRDFKSAVLTAAVHINTTVKTRYKELNTENSPRDGKDLFSYVFSLKNPIFSFEKSETHKESSLQQGYLSLFQGMWMGLRNPLAHANEEISEKDGYEMLMIISHLLRKFEDSTSSEIKKTP